MRVHITEESWYLLCCLLKLLLLTIKATYGAKIPPTRALVEPVP